MRIRVKFTKYGPARFMGHLDTMRYFQKAVRRAKLPVAMSEGFHPHMIMSFAAPLGIGISSDGEYFDIELSDLGNGITSQELVTRLNHSMTEGFHVVCARKVPDGRKYNAMALTAAADYDVKLLEGWKEKADSFYAQPSILVEKKTKNGHKTVDIKPGIYKMQVEGERLFLRLAASSAAFVGPKMVMDAFAVYLGLEPVVYYDIHKIDVYANGGTAAAPCFIPLEKLGEEIG